MSLTFAYTGSLLGLAAIAVPIILHLLARKPSNESPFPSFMFLKGMAARKTRRNNLRKWIVLFLRCLAIASLAAAFAMPFLPDFRAEHGEATVLLWDDSFSMTAKTHGKKLRSMAEKIAARASVSDPVMTGVVSERTKWSEKFFTGPREALSWLELNAANAGNSSFDGALRQADARLKRLNAREKRIVIVTDNQLVPWRDVRLNTPLSPGVRLELAAPEKIMPHNAAIRSVTQKTPSGSGTRAAGLRINVENFSLRDFSGELSVAINGSEVHRRKVGLLANSDSSFETGIIITNGEKHSTGLVELEVEDDIAADNRYYLALNPEPPPLILATSREKETFDYLAAALNPAHSRKNADLQTLDDSTPPGALAAARMLIIRSDAILTPNMAENIGRAMESGARALVLLDGRNQTILRFLDSYGLSIRKTEAAGALRLGNVDFSHPVFRKLSEVKTGSLFDMLFFDPPGVAIRGEGAVVARFTDGSPAFIELDAERGKLFVFCAPLDRRRTSFVAHPLFLPFIRELEAYCREERGEDADQLEVSTIPAVIEGLEKLTDAGGAAAPRVNGEAFVPERPGCFIAAMKNGGTRVIAVNAPAAESDPMMVPEDFNPEQLVSKEPAHDETSGIVYTVPEHGRNFWRLMMALAALFLLGELCLANRAACSNTFHDAQLEKKPAPETARGQHGA